MSKKSLKIWLTIIISIFLSINAFSQNDSVDYSGNRLIDKISVGGDIGLGFGTITYVGLLPQINYKISETITAGIRITYLYWRDNLIDFSTNIYGAGLFGRYYIMQNIFAHAEYEMLNREWIDNKRIFVTGILVGGGFRQQVGNKSYMNILLLWDVNESVQSIYPNPIIRGGIAVGL